MPATQRLRRADLSAFGLWVAAGVLLLVAAMIGPAGQCGYDNHDTYVSTAHRAGLMLLAAALAMATAGTLLGVAALVCSGRRAKIVRAGLGFASVAAGCFTGFIGLLQLIAFGCLE
jgi:hypothetical protein